MKIDQLNYFLETAKHEHIGKASKILGISPSAISHSISSLEVEIGRSLFEKKGKNIFLTSHGKYFAENIGEILGKLNTLKDEVTADNIDHQGHYKIVATHVLSDLLVTPHLSKILSKYPKVSAEVYSLRSANVIKELINGHNDLGFCFCPQDNIKIESEVLLRGKMHLFVKKGHPLLKMSRKEQLKNLKEYSFTLPKSFQGIENCEKHPALAEFDIQSSPQLLHDNVSVCIQALKNSEMFSLFPDYYQNFYPEEIVPILEKECGPTYNISAIWPSNRILTKFLKQLIQDIKKHLSRKVH